MPLYLYACRDCGEQLEVLHPVGRRVEQCGLDCKRRDAGAFGKGSVELLPSAPHIARKPLTNPGEPSTDPLSAAMKPDPGREALRQRALEQLGSDVTEKELDRLRESGMTVYRKSGKRRWEKDGGDDAAPTVIEPKGDE